MGEAFGMYKRCRTDVMKLQSPMCLGVHSRYSARSVMTFNTWQISGTLHSRIPFHYELPNRRCQSNRAIVGSDEGISLS